MIQLVTVTYTLTTIPCIFKLNKGKRWPSPVLQIDENNFPVPVRTKFLNKLLPFRLTCRKGLQRLCSLCQGADCPHIFDTHSQSRPLLYMTLKIWIIQQTYNLEHYDGNYIVVNERHGYELKERAQNLYGVRFHLRAAFSNINPPPSFHDCTFYSTYV